MQQRVLGRSGIAIAPLMFGGNVFGWTADEPTSFAMLDAFVGAGFNAIDTADVYAKWISGIGGESETIIGNWLKRSGRRQDVVICTKVGMPMTTEKGGLAPEYIMQAVEESLRRLQTDYIDVYFAHRDDEQTPLEDTLGAFAELVRQGKVRALGASNYSGARLTEALAVSARLQLPRFECVQPHYNLYERASYEVDLEPVCRTNQLGVTPYYALAAGFLTGKYRSAADLSQSPRGQGISKFLNPRGLRIVAALHEVAQRLDAKPAQVALAWLMAQPSIAAPIASATGSVQLREILAAADLALDSDALDALNTASAPAAA